MPLTKTVSQPITFEPRSTVPKAGGHTTAPLYQAKMFIGDVVDTFRVNITQPVNHKFYIDGFMVCRPDTVFS